MAKQFSVDRARFLAFAAAFAGATSFQACSATDTAPGGDGGNAGAVEGGATHTGGYAGTSDELLAGSAGEGGSAGADSAGAGGAGGDSSGEGAPLREAPEVRAASATTAQVSLHAPE